MRFSVKAFWVQKEGNPTKDYEDAYFHNVEAGRFVVSDGATEAAFAQPWARCLVELFTSLELPRSPVEFHDAFLVPLQRKWLAEIPWETIPGYAKKKVREGAQATLLGLQFFPSEVASGNSVYRWESLAVGDSCLLHVRADSLDTSFPVKRSQDFNNRPPLVSSNPTHNRLLCKNLKFAQGDCREGDVFLLATDALAQWFLAQSEEGEKPWAILRNFHDACQFEKFVNQLREERRIRNDDTTLLAIRPLPLQDMW